MIRSPGPILGSGYPTRIKSRQLATFSWAASVASGANSQAQSINSVDTNKSVLRMIAPASVYVGNPTNFMNWLLYAYFNSGTSVQGVAEVGSNYNSNTYPISFQVEIIEYWEKPKRKQNMAGNGTTTQTISTVDPNKVEIEMRSTGGTDPHKVASINATSIVWDRAIGSSILYQVIEWE